MPCAEEFVPLFNDCKSLVNTVFDVHSSDAIRDGNASAFYNFKDTCIKTPAAQYVAMIDSLIDLKCKVNLTDVFVAPSEQSACEQKGDSDTVQKITGHTCLQAKEQNLCSMLHLLSIDRLCPCECKHTLNPVGRRHLFLQGSKCTVSTFDGRMNSILKTCCGGGACTKISKTCNFDCAKVRALSFFWIS